MIIIDEALAENKVETKSIHASHHDLTSSDEEEEDIHHKSSGKHVVFSDEVDV